MSLEKYLGNLHPKSVKDLFPSLVFPCHKAYVSRNLDCIDNKRLTHFTLYITLNFFHEIIDEIKMLRIYDILLRFITCI